MYDLTGDPKYLEPVRRHIEWEKTAIMMVKVDGEEKPRRGQLVDHESGRPIAVDLKRWTIHYLDTPEDRAAFVASGAARFRTPDRILEDEFPWHLYTTTPRWPTLEPELESRLQGARPQPTRLVGGQLAGSVSRYAGDRLDKVLAEQNEEEVWPVLATEFSGQGSNNIGTFFYLVDDRAYQLLSVLERSKIIAGEIEREIWDFPGLLLVQAGEHPLHNRNWMDLSR